MVENSVKNTEKILTGDMENLIVQNMTEGILQISGKGIISAANEAAIAILEPEDEEIVGLPAGLVLLNSEYNDDFFQLFIDAAMEPEHLCQGTVTYGTGDKVKYLKAVTYAEIISQDEKKHELLTTIGFQDISDYIAKNQMEEEIHSINKMNRSMELRNKLIRKIFGCFVVRQQDDQDLLTSDRMEELKQGTEKSVTIIQSDLRGYTAMTNRISPEDMIQIMNYYINAMTEIILAHHGVIIEVMGDGVVSAFGALGHEESQCEDAIAAAVEMQSRMPSVNDWLRSHHYDAHLKMGIGIDYGRAIMGFVGNGNMRSFDIMGAVISKADEIQGNTVEGDILISDRVRARVSVDLTLGKEMQLYLKHAGEEVDAYQVKAIGAPYHLNCPVFTEEREKLKNSAKLAFYIVNGKVRENDQIDCTIREISDSELLISCEKKLENLTNIVAEIGGDLYGKIVDCSTEGYVVSITGAPDVFKEWKTNILK